MKVGERVRIVRGRSIFGPPQFMIGKGAIVIELPVPRALLPQWVVLLDSGDKWPCQKDEMELVPAGK